MIYKMVITRVVHVLSAILLWHILRIIKIISKDRLSFYRFQKKPTHSRGYHFIPSNLLNLEKSTVDGKERLSRLSETAFQELCADVYDEVNRGLWIPDYQSSLDTGGNMKCPKKYVEDIFCTWYHMHFFDSGALSKKCIWHHAQNISATNFLGHFTVPSRISSIEPSPQSAYENA